MKEKLPTNEEARDRCDEIFASLVESISICYNIFQQLPLDIAEAIRVKAKDCQQSSIIVITDENSQLGRYASNFIIGDEDVVPAREEPEPPEVFVGLASRELIRSFKKYYCEKLHLELPPYDVNKVPICVISDTITCYTLSANLKSTLCS